MSSFADLMGELKTRLELHDALTANDMDRARALEASLKHERATTGVDRRHWSETTIPGSEDQS